MPPETAPPVYRRAEHRVVAAVLASMDADLLTRCRCYFGGGTAAVLRNGEYRISRDVHFLCSDPEGYRELRTAAVGRGIHALFGPEVSALREFRIDQYGLRTVIGWEGHAIRFEAIREARLQLDGGFDVAFGVPTLSIEFQFAEKLLANADRGLDRSTGCRDVVDLGFLIRGHGNLPPDSVRLAEEAYGADIRSKLAKVTELLADPAEIRRTADTLAMELPDVEEAVGHASAALAAWPSQVR
jgi:hypothetical protein